MSLLVAPLSAILYIAIAIFRSIVNYIFTTNRAYVYVCLGLSEGIKYPFPWLGEDVYLPDSPTKCLVYILYLLSSESRRVRRHAPHL